MRTLLIALKWGIVILCVSVIALAVFPPPLLKLANSYAAKTVCSAVFLAKRDLESTLKDDAQAPGNPILRMVTATVDEKVGVVTARVLWLLAPRQAIYRPGYGCTNVATDKDFSSTLPPMPKPAAVSPDKDWPEGNRANPHAIPSLTPLLADEVLRGPGMRAIVVVFRGRIVAEAYGSGISRNTPLLGWSMTKTVNAILVGRVIEQKLLSLREKNLFPEWQTDKRRDIPLADIAAMESGLVFEEQYGGASDATRMLYLQADMSMFAINKPIETMPGLKFNYSSGASVMLAKLWMNRLSGGAAAYSFPRKELFDPLGMESAVMELDEQGVFVGSSYLYASAPDWARIGLFLLQDGVWEGRRLLPAGFVRLMKTANGTSSGQYSQMQTWLMGPGKKPNKTFGVPDDTFWLQGHDGQTVAVIPSRELVVVRLGVTPSRLEYRPQKLIAAINNRLPD